MWNIILDEKPNSWNGYAINTDFRTGIQLCQLMTDTELSEHEKVNLLCQILFPGVMPEQEDITEVINWFLGGWQRDKHDTRQESKVRVIDYDIDQWRIYSAFLWQYGINLNTTDLHYWEFMGLLTTLEECSFTRVIDIRQKKIVPKMSKEEKKATARAKEIYGLEQEEAKETQEEIEKRKESVEVFNRLRGAL